MNSLGGYRRERCQDIILDRIRGHNDIAGMAYRSFECQVVARAFESVETCRVCGGVGPGKMGFDQIVDGYDRGYPGQNRGIEVKGIEKIWFELMQEERELRLLHT